MESLQKNISPDIFLPDNPNTGKFTKLIAGVVTAVILNGCSNIPTRYIVVDSPEYHILQKDKYNLANVIADLERQKGILELTITQMNQEDANNRKYSGGGILNNRNYQLFDQSDERQKYRREIMKNIKHFNMVIREKKIQLYLLNQLQANRPR